MSQDIRNFFSRTPGKNVSTKTPESNNKKKKRYNIDSESDDEFVTPKSKKNKTSKELKTSKSKNESEEKKSKYFEIDKHSLQSMFGKDPVKRTQTTAKEKQSSSVKKLSDSFQDDDNFAAAVMELDDSDEEWVKQMSVGSSGYQSQTQSNSQTSSIDSSPTVKSNLSQKHLSNNSQDKVKTSVFTSPKKCINKSPIKIESKSTNEVGKIKKEEIKKVVNVSPKKKQDEKEWTQVERQAPLVSGLWVDKYKPSNIKQIIGQQGDKSNVNKLVKWLKDWHVNHSGTKKLSKPSPWAKDDSGAYFKAALLSGPPGVGKTTTAHLVCKELGMDMVEFNASDTRSKKLLNQEVGELLSSKSLSPFFVGNTGGGEVTKKHVLVMDEVDGMAGNEDRGGVQELITLIKNSKIPVICMCNDRNHPKIRSLANYCFDLRFNKPRADQIKGAMLSVCFKEKLKIKPDVLMDIITNTNQDIRLILNHLSMLAASSNDSMKASSKDIKIGPWDVLRKVFSEEDHKTMSIHDKSDLFFHDYSIAPLFVQENYLMVVPHSPASKSKQGKMSLFAKAAESIANGDLVDRAIRSSGAWSLLPTQAMFSSLVPGDLLEGHMGGQIQFPNWLGKNSKKSKMDRLTQEIQSHTRLKLSASKEDVGLDYAKALYNSVVLPLSDKGSEGAEDSLQVMREYSLLREDLDSLSQLCDWNLRPDPFTKLESKVKAAFTRAYNKCPLMSPFAQVSAVKKKGKRTGGEDEYGEEEEDAIASEEEQDDDDITTDAMIMFKKKTDKKVANKNEAGPSTSKRGTGSSKQAKKAKK